MPEGVHVTGTSTYLHPLAPTEAAQTASPAIDTAFANNVRVDIHLEAFVAGTTPSVTFVLETLGLGGRWYQVWTSGAVTAAPSDISVDVGLFAATYVAGTTTMHHAVLGAQTRLRWTFGGGVAPTSVTFSASVNPRP
jgi:hypothetical protein